MTERLAVARCINPAHSEDQLVHGQTYGVLGGELYYGVRYFRVYQIPDSAWGLNIFHQSDDKVWYYPNNDTGYLGEFQSYRFDILHRKPQMAAEIKRMRDMFEFTKRSSGDSPAGKTG